MTDADRLMQALEELTPLLDSAIDELCAERAVWSEALEAAMLSPYSRDLSAENGAQGRLDVAQHRVDAAERLRAAVSELRARLDEDD